MKMHNQVRIRLAVPQDGPVFLALVEALALYERVPPPDEAAKDRLLRDAFAEHPRFAVLLAEVSGAAVGYAVLLETYSTFLAQPTLFLEDIFVLETHRHRGIGRMIFQHCVREAIRRGCGRMEWIVLYWNQLAIDFYQRIGAKRNKDWIPFRLVRMEMEQLIGEMDRQGAEHP